MSTLAGLQAIRNEQARALAGIDAMIEEAQRSEPAESSWPAPGPFRFSRQSLDRMQGVHPDLRAVAHYALRICPVDFGIPATGGVRTEEMQRDLVAKGASRTMNSRHLTGHAIDVYGYVDGKATWEAKYILPIHDAFMEAAQALNLKLRWGGDWNGDGVREPNETDAVHHELPKSVYGTRSDSLAPRAAAFLATV